MIEALVGLSLRNRPFVIFVWVLTAFAGVVSLARLPMDAVPDITNVQVQILTKSPALGPVEVEQFVTYPVEAAMTGLPDVEEIRSISRYGLSAVTVVFRDGTDLHRSRVLVEQRLTQARERIPAGFGVPEMGPMSTGLGEVYHFVVEGAGSTPTELRTILDWEIAYRLRMVPGIVEVNAWGGYLRRLEVQLDPNRLVAHRIPLTRVFEAIQRNNAIVGSASIERAQQQLLIRGDGLVSTLKDVEDIVVAVRASGTPVRIRDLGWVREGYVPRLGAATENGTGETVIGLANMFIGENAREVSTRVDRAVRDLQATLPPGVRIRPYYNRSDLVNRVLRTVATNLTEGGLIVVAVLFLMLGNLRAGLIVALAIPLSMLVAFLGMTGAGISGNLMSLGAIDFGLLVDGAVVMVEHLLRRLRESSARGEARLEMLRAAAREVARPVAFGVGIIIIVYLPILTLTGTEGRMFRPMAWTVVFALIGALLLALTLVPVLASLALRPQDADHDTWLVRLLHRAYRPSLAWVMRRRRAMGLAALGLVAGSALLFARLGGEFLPHLDEGDLVIQAWRLPGISLEESVRTTGMVERALKRFQEVAGVVSRTGSPEVATDVMGVELSDVFVQLTPLSTWPPGLTKADLVERMAAALPEEVPGVGFSFTQPIEMRFNELLYGVRSDIVVKVFGPDLAVLRELGETVSRVLARTPGAVDVRVEQVAGLPTLRARVDRARIARYGVDAADALATVEAIRAGRTVGVAMEGVRRFDIAVRFAHDHPIDVDHIRNLPVFSPAGVPVPLGQLTDITIEEGPAQVSHEATQRRVAVECNVRSRDIAGFVQDAKARLARDLRLPAGYSLTWGGTFQQYERARARLAVVVPLALLLIFVLLYATFDSMRAALLIYTGVPLAAVGGVLSLWARGMPFSISAGVGFIALFGIAVLNGIVMVAEIRRLQALGAAPGEAATEGAVARLRAVVTTALVASLGFLPMALSASAGAEVQRPLATVVIGGLLTSTLLTLFVLPSLYSRFGPPTVAGARAAQPQDPAGRLTA